ncbi:MAG: prolyl oligopeptidase family serine peptidase [Saprospiraceae bacterium]|nr:prolyl oligopeptidase family serine peptidase [Saprospiraceae bacterium]
MNKSLILFLLVFMLKTSILAQGSYQTLQADSMKLGEYVRTFLYHTPQNLPKKPKLLFVLHGSGGSGQRMVQFTEHWFSKLADAQGDVIVVYPNGYKEHWNECRKEANFEANLLNIDDNTFFEKMIDYFVQKYHINRKQVFVVGHSNGGHEVFKLAKERPRLFKKYAAVSANLPTPSNDDCVATNKPVSMMVINGTGDKINPYQGGEVVMTGSAKRGNVVSTDETMRYWANLAKKDFSKAIPFDFPDTDKEDGTTATQFSLTTKKYTIRLIKIENGGHVLSVPTKTPPPAFIGKAIRDINMAQVVFDFFFKK